MTHMTRDTPVMTHVTIDIWSRRVIRNWGSDNSRRVSPDYWGRGNYKPVRGPWAQGWHQHCCVRIETSRGSPLLRIKAPCFRGFALDYWVFASEDSSRLTVIVFSQETVFAWGEILVFPPSESGAVQCPARGRKETTGLIIDIQEFSIYLGLWSFKAHGVGCDTASDLRDQSKRAVESRAHRSELRSAARTLSALWSVGGSTCHIRAGLWRVKERDSVT